MSSPTYKREPLTPDEITKLTSVCTLPKEKLVIFTLLDTGLRVSELSTLTKDNIDWQGHRLTIFGKSSRQAGGKPKRRVVPMSDRVRGILEPWISAQDKVGLHIQTIQSIVKRVAQKAGITKKVTPHVLRHTFACMCLRKKMAITTVKNLLGHDHLITTMLYLNMTNEEALVDFEGKW